MATRTEKKLDMPPDVGFSESYNVSKLTNLSAMAYSADWAGALEVQVQFERLPFKTLYTLDSDGGEVNPPPYDLPHAYKNVRVEVTRNDSGTIPTVVVAGRT